MLSAKAAGFSFAGGRWFEYSDIVLGGKQIIVLVTFREGLDENLI